MITEDENGTKLRTRGRCWLHDVEWAATGECIECAKMLANSQPGTVEIFDDGNDDGYRAWITTHRGGYVINLQKTHNPSDAILHQATCHTINDEPARGEVFVGASYVKVCAVRRAELVDWAIRNVGTSIPLCQICF